MPHKITESEFKGAPELIGARKKYLKGGRD